MSLKDLIWVALQPRATRDFHISEKILFVHLRDKDVIDVRSSLISKVIGIFRHTSAKQLFIVR
jgi:hypothetical protein